MRQEQRRQPANRGNGVTPFHPAVLVNRPRTLHVLWAEYQQGIDGNKPARDFTREERGGDNKDRYWKRKQFWNLVQGLVSAQRGTAGEVIDAVYQQYGWNTSVTKILAQITEDTKKRTLHHTLRI